MGLSFLTYLNIAIVVAWYVYTLYSGAEVQ